MQANHLADTIRAADRRLTGHIEHAVRAHALGDITDTEAAVAGAEAAISLWNGTADEIDARYDAGWFAARMTHANAFTVQFRGDLGRALVQLEYLSATERTPIIDWMTDFATVALCVPESHIENEAKAKGGLWDRKLRKQAASKSLARSLALDAFLADQDESKRKASLIYMDWRCGSSAGAKQPPITSPVAKSHPADD